MSDLEDQLLERLLIVVSEEMAGLWELIAEGRNIAAGLGEGELRVAARKAALKALSAGWARLVVGSFPAARWSTIDDAEIHTVLLDPLNWYPPASHDAWHVRIEATPAGDEEARRRLTRQ